MRWSGIGGLFVLLSTTACQAVLPVLTATPSRNRIQAARPAYQVTGAASSRDEFRVLVHLQGVDLSADDLSRIAQATTVLPNGRYQDDLLGQWQDHGLPAIASPDAFADAALQFARQRDATVGFYFDAKRFRETGDIVVAHWEAVQGQYLELSQDGTIRAYRPHLSEPPAEMVRVPADLFPGAL